MLVKAKLRNLRIAPRKVRLVVDLVRGKTVDEAQTILRFTVKKGAALVLKLLNSAVANARHNFQLEPENLYIQKITVDEGPKYKRWMPRARGSASEIQKKTAHITLVLDEIKGLPKTKKPKAKKEILTKKEKKPSLKEEKIYPVKSAKGSTSLETEQFNEVNIKEEREKKIERLKIKPIPPFARPKPKIIQGIRRIFRRKSM